MRFKLEIDLDETEVEAYGIDDVLPHCLRSVAQHVAEGHADAGTVRSGDTKAKWRTTDGTLVRDRALVMIPIPNNSEPGEQLYLCVVDTTQDGNWPEYVIGRCKWNDTEWELGYYTSSLARALAKVVDRLDEWTK